MKWKRLRLLTSRYVTHEAKLVSEQCQTITAATTLKTEGCHVLTSVWCAFVRQDCESRRHKAANSSPQYTHGEVTVSAADIGRVSPTWFRIMRGASHGSSSFRTARRRFANSIIGTSLPLDEVDDVPSAPSDAVNAARDIHRFASTKFI